MIHCRYCGGEITFEITKHGNPRPRNASDGEIHFDTCQRARSAARSKCIHCGEKITWEITHKGKPRPLNLDGEIHFTTCTAKKIHPPVLRDDCACDCPDHGCWYCRRGEHIRALPAADLDQQGLDD